LILFVSSQYNMHLMDTFRWKQKKASRRFLSLISLSVFAFSEGIREIHSIFTLLFERPQSVYNIHQLRPPFHWVRRSRLTFPRNVKHQPKVCSSTKNQLTLFDFNSFFFHFDLIHVTICTDIEQDVLKMIWVRMVILAHRKPAIWYLP